MSSPIPTASSSAVILAASGAKVLVNTGVEGMGALLAWSAGLIGAGTMLLRRGRATTLQAGYSFDD